MGFLFDISYSEEYSDLCSIDSRRFHGDSNPDSWSRYNVGPEDLALG
jgi:hypothetical protein